jgi:hypothetical protein
MGSRAVKGEGRRWIVRIETMERVVPVEGFTKGH